MAYMMRAAPVLLNTVWNYASKTKPFNYVKEKLKSVLGIDLNDDDDRGYNKFNYNGSMGKNISWSDINPHI